MLVAIKSETSLLYIGGRRHFEQKWQKSLRKSAVLAYIYELSCDILNLQVV